ncbi:MAG TPA: sigma-54 dependent transcriptional regulator, partial [Candidatus Latescibacteria bacterium]|nr:sigma-54 dependent transcriptional regulator [Candidatus Latescibacterota bacterium]
LHAEPAHSAGHRRWTYASRIRSRRQHRPLRRDDPDHRGKRDGQGGHCSIHPPAQLTRTFPPFVSVNCAGLPEGVLESELFGHERGAFTGALRQRPGRFEQARDGTIFLDEIGAADARVQQRLLRVLQERCFERVGGTQTLTNEARVVAATNVDLQAEVEAGHFREDLYCHLHVVPVDVPPLRERREDIAHLVDHFLHQHTERVDGISERATQCLVEYPWPGNIRELENTIERMVVLAEHRLLDLIDVPEEILNWRGGRAVERLNDLGAVTYREAREWFDRQFLRRALKRHQGVVTHVADAIGMSRKNLYCRLTRLGIDPARFRPGRPFE